MSIEIIVQPTAPSFVVGEGVTFRLTIRNSGSTPVTVADPLLHEVDPVYTVTAPDGAVKQVRLLSARVPSPLIEPNAPPAEIAMEIPANSAWSEELVLDPMLLLTEPGSYLLQATVSERGTPVASAPASFTIEAARVTAFGAAFGPVKSAASRLFVSWAHAGKTGARIVEEVRGERAWGDDRRGKLYSGALASQVRGPVEQVAVAEPLFVRGMDFHGWVAWTEPGAISVLRTNAGKAEGGAQIVLKTTAPTSLIGPLAMNGSHDARLYAVERGPGGAQLTRVDVPRDLSGQAKVVSRTALPFAPESTVALHDEHARSVIVLAGTSDGTTSVVAVDDGAKPRVVEFGPLGPWVRGRPLGARRISDGRIEVVCLTSDARHPHQARMFRAVLETEPLSVRSQSSADVPGLDPAEIRWASVAALGGGEQILWRSAKGEIYTRGPAGAARRLADRFADSPVPQLLSPEGDTFVAAVREGGTFGIERLAP